MVLCANKTDLPEEMWEVSREQFNLFAEENKLSIFEASASSGARVEEVLVPSLSVPQWSRRSSLLLDNLSWKIIEVI